MVYSTSKRGIQDLVATLALKAPLDSPIFVGNVTIQDKLDVPEISNTGGSLKIQPDVQGDVVLFSDTQVEDNENSPYFYLHRKAPEGNTYVRLFINSSQRAYFHGSPPGGFYMQGQVDMGVKSVTEDVILQVGDSEGVKKIRFQDSDGNTKGYVDSNGNVQFDGDVRIDGNLGVGITPTEFLHAEKDYDGVLVSRFYNSNSNGVSQHLVGAAGGGHINLIANSGPGPHIGIPVNMAGISVNYGNALVFAVGDTGSANEIMRLTPIGLGIGTIDPQLPLDIRNDDDNLALFFDTTAQAQGVGGGIAFGGKYTDAGAEAMAGRIGTQKTNSISGHIGFDMVLETQNSVGSMTERMIFTSDGKIGINNPNPATQLDIIGNVLISDNLTITGYILPLTFLPEIGVKLDLYGGNYAIGVESSELRIASNSKITFRTDGYSGDVDVAISDNGYFGIGTDSPHDNFHIKAASPSFVFEDTDAPENEKIWEWLASGGMLSLKTNNDLYTGSQTVISIDRGGTSPTQINFPNSDVAIGTSTPEGSAALEIDSTSGALLLPRMTTNQRNDLTPINGMMVYDTTQNAFRVYENGAWRSI